MNEIRNLSNHQSENITSSGAVMTKLNQSQTQQQMQLGAWQLWRSLPRPCKLFLVVCVVQAFVAGAFAARELARVRNLVIFFLVNSFCVVGTKFPNHLVISFAAWTFQPSGSNSHPNISDILFTAGSRCFLS
jgi:hypothetical protein